MDNIKDTVMYKNSKFKGIPTRIFLIKMVRAFTFGSMILFFISILFIPRFSLILGNVFFGDIKPLYNIKFAQALYWHAAYPILPLQSPKYAHYQLSRTYFIYGKQNEAFEEVNKELKTYPENTQSYYILGLTNGYMNRTYEAIDAFSYYINAHPESWAGRNDKAWLQFRLGDIDGALETMQPIIKRYPETPWVQNTYCALLINKPERLEEAKEVCTLSKNLVDKMTSKDWGRAYPGNDPRIYATGLEAMQISAEKNLQIVREKNVP